MAKATTKADLQSSTVGESNESVVSSYRDYSPTDIQVLPYFDPNIPNMGLEKYGQVFFEGTGMMQSLRSTEINGVVRYVTGLDEFAISIKKISNDEQRLARIKTIRETVSNLEYELFGNKVSPDDSEFWTKVTLAPTREDYWQNIKLSVGNDGKYLDPKKPEDLLLIIAIENGGFDDVASSKEAAQSMIKPPKLYLEKRRDTKIQEGRLKESRDKAIYELYKMRMEVPQDMFYIAKNLLPIANNYKLSDKLEIIYSDLNDYIEGLSIERDKKKAPLKFLEWINKEKEYLVIRAYVLDAIFWKYLVTKGDNKIYIKDTGSMLGGNIEECIEYLRQAQNQRDLDYIEAQVDAQWKR